MSSPSESLVSKMLKSVQPCPYIKPNITKADVLAVLHHYKGLSPKLDEFMFGRKRKLLHLVGTIPVPYKGLTYNIPISVTLLSYYPYIAPFVFVKPTADQQIKVSKHVRSTCPTWTVGPVAPTY